MQEAPYAFLGLSVSLPQLSEEVKMIALHPIVCERLQQVQPQYLSTDSIVEDSFRHVVVCEERLDRLQTLQHVRPTFLKQCLILDLHDMLDRLVDLKHCNFTSFLILGLLSLLLEEDDLLIDRSND